MKKTLLLPVLGLIALWSFNLIGQDAHTDKGGKPPVHQARFNVFDYTSGDPVADAALYDKLDKELGRTDAKGMLTLALPASALDIYMIKSSGFSPVNVRLTHADKKFADYEVFLRPDPSAIHDTGDTELVKVYIKQDPHVNKQQEQPTATAKAPAAQAANEGDVEFAVQLSASSRPISDKKTLRTWEELGPVFIQNENGLYKVRIGPYTTQENAKKVLLAVKERGKSDAFIVVQKGRENHTPFDYESHKSHQAMTESAPAAKPAVVEPTTDNEPQGEYKVRIASYLHPGAFNTADVEQYGTLESYRKGEWTIMMIGGIKKASEAKRIRDLVIQKGYKDAAVVVDNEGILEELK
jgi:hypothetical protein